jgi:K+/H+ antiporter YhaU regulatory subunit KhtT
MIAIITLLIVLALSLFITRVATVALTHTGLSRDTARFQARSALTGVGFTTNESEQVVNHPVRRRILQILMILGNVGIVTAVSSLIISFVNVDDSANLPLRLFLLIAGMSALYVVAQSKWIDSHLSNVISTMLKKHTRLDVRDYVSLLHLAGEYRVTELNVRDKDWICGRTLSETRLRDEGIMVLGINRLDGSFLGAPQGSTRVLEGDSLIIYGRATALENLDTRRRGKRGDQAHRKMVREQEKIEKQEEVHDSAEHEKTST